MSRSGLAAIGLALVLGSTAAGHGSGAQAPAEPHPSLPGVELARTLTTATGIAITPLLGISVVGAWHYFSTPEPLRRQLPWYGSMLFWLPGCLIALALVFKDQILGLAPLAKKPLDALDVLENKASALLAMPVVIPMFVSAFATPAVLTALEGATGGALAHAGLGADSGALSSLPGILGLSIASVLFLAAFGLGAAVAWLKETAGRGVDLAQRTKASVLR